MFGLPLPPSHFNLFNLLFRQGRLHSRRRRLLPFRQGRLPSRRRRHPPWPTLFLLLLPLIIPTRVRCTWRASALVALLRVWSPEIGSTFECCHRTKSPFSGSYSRSVNRPQRRPRDRPRRRTSRRLKTAMIATTSPSSGISALIIPKGKLYYWKYLWKYDGLIYLAVQLCYSFIQCKIYVLLFYYVRHLCLISFLSFFKLYREEVKGLRDKNES